jgi:hypothetical protein
MFEEGVDSIKEETVWDSSTDRLEAPIESGGKGLNDTERFQPVLVLFADLVDRIKKALDEVRSLADSSEGKFSDLAFGHNFRRRVTQETDKSEAELNCFLEYLKIRFPVRRRNTVHVILEEVLKKHEKKMMERRIRILKKQYETDLPEATVHVEELKFVLNWLLEYAIISAAPQAHIGILTRSVDIQQGQDQVGSLSQKGKKYIEILIVFGAYERRDEQMGFAPKTKAARQQIGSDFILPLVNEIVKKNQGMVKSSVNHEGHLRMVSLTLPIERRKIVYYQTAWA